MQRLTLDRCCVISAAEGPAAGMPVLELIALAEQGEVDLALTTAFDMELPAADAAKAARLSAFLSGCPVLGATRVAGPFILGFCNARHRLPLRAGGRPRLGSDQGDPPAWQPP